MSLCFRKHSNTTNVKGTRPVRGCDPCQYAVEVAGAARPAAVIDLPAQQLDLLWAPDGKRLLVTKEVGSPPETSFETVLLGPETGRAEPFDCRSGRPIRLSSGP